MRDFFQQAEKVLSLPHWFSGNGLFVIVGLSAVAASMRLG